MNTDKDMNARNPADIPKLTDLGYRKQIARMNRTKQDMIKARQEIATQCLELVNLLQGDDLGKANKDIIADVLAEILHTMT